MSRDELPQAGQFSVYVCKGALSSSVYPQVASLTAPQIPGLVPSGPTHWKEMAPACGGPAQSPINIDLHLVQQDPTLGPFIFQGYSSAPPGPWTLENDGHTGQYPGTRTPHRQEQEPPGSGSYCSPPSHPPHTQGSKSPQSASERPHTLVKTLSTGVMKPHIQGSGPPQQ